MSAAFSPDGKRIVTGSEDKTGRLWDAETGKQIGAPLSAMRTARCSAPAAKRICSSSKRGLTPGNGGLCASAMRAL